MSKQVALIQITNHGSDIAVFLDGEYVISADPSAGEQTEMVEHVAHSLAVIHGVEIVKIEFPAKEDWQWHDIQTDLQNDGRLAGGLKDYPIEYMAINSQGEISKMHKLFHAEDIDHAIEQFINENASEEEKLLWIEAPTERPKTQLFKEGDNDFYLAPYTAERVWITVGNASILIKQEAEGVAVDFYPVNKELSQPVNSAYVFFSDMINEVN